jgi:hypothetical protein
MWFKILKIENRFIQEYLTGKNKLRNFEIFFSCGEGPRSRCYGRTAAFRLIVQHCDKDG